MPPPFALARARKGPLSLLHFVQRRERSCDRLSATRALRCKCHGAGDRAPQCQHRSVYIPAWALRHGTTSMLCYWLDIHKSRDDALI